MIVSFSRLLYHNDCVLANVTWVKMKQGTCAQSVEEEGKRKRKREEEDEKKNEEEEEEKMEDGDMQFTSEQVLYALGIQCIRT